MRPQKLNYRSQQDSDHGSHLVEKWFWRPNVGTYLPGTSPHQPWPASPWGLSRTNVKTMGEVLQSQRTASWSIQSRLSAVPCRIPRWVQIAIPAPQIGIQPHFPDSKITTRYPRWFLASDMAHHGTEPHWKQIHQFDRSSRTCQRNEVSRLESRIRCLPASLDQIQTRSTTTGQQSPSFDLSAAAFTSWYH